jgi:hypothetical protein
MFSPQRREGRRDLFFLFFAVVETAKNKRALFQKIFKPLRSLRLCGE